MIARNLCSSLRPARLEGVVGKGNGALELNGVEYELGAEYADEEGDEYAVCEGVEEYAVDVEKTLTFKASRSFLRTAV